MAMATTLVLLATRVTRQQHDTGPGALQGVPEMSPNHPDIVSCHVGEAVVAPGGTRWRCVCPSFALCFSGSS
jgi:hypothetical protein